MQAVLHHSLKPEALSAGRAPLSECVGRLAIGWMTVLFDEEDRALVESYRWHLKPSYGKTGTLLGYYAVTRERRKGEPRRMIFLHRLLLGAKPGELVDHIDRDGLNNRRSNLRICTSRQNAINRPRPAWSRVPYRGVFYRVGAVKKLYGAQITIEGAKRYLGGHTSPEEAALAYDRAARLHHGEFAQLNFPQVGGC